MLNFLLVAAAEWWSILPSLPTQTFASFIVFIIVLSSGKTLYSWLKLPKDIALASYPFLSVGTFILSVFLTAAIFPKHLTQIILILGIIWILFAIKALMSLRHSRFTLRTLFNTKVIVFGLAIFLLVLIFNHFLFENGLHDEYWHHAVLNLYVQTQQYPFFHPFIWGFSINRDYHFGLYFYILSIRNLLPWFSLPEVLDISKLSLVWGSPLVMYAVGKHIIGIRSWCLRVGASFASLVTGPTLFLFDSFAQNVMFGNQLAQAASPILFELAGITWTGVVFLLAWLLVLIQFVKKKKNWSTLLFFVLSLVTLFIINRAFAGCYAVIGGFILLQEFVFNARTSFLIKGSLLAGFLLLGLFITQWTHVLLIRPIVEWGFMFQPDSRLTTIPFNIISMFSIEGIQGFGLSFLLAPIALLILKVPTRTSKAILLVCCVVLPVITYILTVHELLAMNKLLRPALLLNTIILFRVLEISMQKRLHRIVPIFLGCLLLSGIFPGLWFFSTTRIRHVQEFWAVQDPQEVQLIQTLRTLPNGKPYHILTNSASMQNTMANTVPAQVMTVPLKNIASYILILDSTETVGSLTPCLKPTIINSRFSWCNIPE